jgi:hypothetical protein
MKHNSRIRFAALLLVCFVAGCGGDNGTGVVKESPNTDVSMALVGAPSSDVAALLVVRPSVASVKVARSDVLAHANIGPDSTVIAVFGSLQGPLVRLHLAAGTQIPSIGVQEVSDTAGAVRAAPTGYSVVVTLEPSTDTRSP